MLVVDCNSRALHYFCYEVRQWEHLAPVPSIPFLYAITILMLLLAIAFESLYMLTCKILFLR
ncbi:MAG: hypothetical protein F6K54_35140 [Okeania sp. SIO3B5]|nr:hypothetical protein [Okeania sp. SIO3B5]